MDDFKVGDKVKQKQTARCDDPRLPGIKGKHGNKMRTWETHGEIVAINPDTGRLRIRWNKHGRNLQKLVSLPPHSVTKERE